MASARENPPAEAPAKRGRGRPPAKLPDDVIERLGHPPTDDPVAAAKWVSKLLLELAWLECCGRSSQKLGERIRATCGAIIRAMPDHVRAELDARIRGDDAGSDADAPGQRPEAVKRGPSAVRR